jgi:arylsulfatase A-like enzyme
VQRRDSIVWIVTTQWRAQACGYAGDLNARTPWLDGLASDAVDYAQAVTPHPLGPQARAALLTGRLSPQNGVADYWDPLPANARTIAHEMADRGYTTGFFGKWHLAERDRGVPLVGDAHARQVVPPARRGGFAMWEGFEGGFLLNDPWLHGTRFPSPRHFKGYQADVLVQRAAEWLRESRTLPAFCVLSLESPHPPYHAPTPHVAETSPADIRLRANVPPGGDVEKKARDELAGYYAHIEATDRAIGKFLAELDLGSTRIIFTSVHGDMHGSHGQFRKAWPYEESIRVPLLVRIPHEPDAGKRRDEPVNLADLFHLTLAWADGAPWKCQREHSVISMPTAASVAHQCPYAWRGIRSTSEKKVSRIAPDGRETPWLHFDLRNDPYELRNLV